MELKKFVTEIVKDWADIIKKRILISTETSRYRKKTNIYYNWLFRNS